MRGGCFHVDTLTAPARPCGGAGCRLVQPLPHQLPALPGESQRETPTAPSARVLFRGWQMNPAAGAAYGASAEVLLLRWWWSGPRGSPASARKVLEENTFAMLQPERLSPKLAKGNINIHLGSQLI